MSSDVKNYFVTFTAGEKVTEKELVTGSPVRLLSYTFTPVEGTAVPDTGETGIKFMDGTGGTVLHQEQYVYVTANTQGARYALPVTFPGHGILFNSGIFAQGVGEGISSVSICYQGSG